MFDDKYVIFQHTKENKKFVSTNNLFIKKFKRYAHDSGIQQIGASFSWSPTKKYAHD